MRGMYARGALRTYDEGQVLVVGVRGPLGSGVMHVVVLADLDQVPVGIAEVERVDRPERAGALDRAFLDGYVRACERRLDGLQRHGGDEAEVGRSRRRSQGPGIELATGLVEVELLLAESQRHATVAEAFPVHIQRALVERDRRLDVSDGEHEMVETIDHRRIVSGAWARIACSDVHERRVLYVGGTVLGGGPLCSGGPRQAVACDPAGHG